MYYEALKEDPYKAIPLSFHVKGTKDKSFSLFREHYTSLLEK